MDTIHFKCKHFLLEVSHLLWYSSKHQHSVLLSSKIGYVSCLQTCANREAYDPHAQLQLGSYTRQMLMAAISLVQGGYGGTPTTDTITCITVGEYDISTIIVSLQTMSEVLHKSVASQVL